MAGAGPHLNHGATLPRQLAVDQHSDQQLMPTRFKRQPADTPSSGAIGHKHLALALDGATKIVRIKPANPQPLARGRHGLHLERDRIGVVGIGNNGHAVDLKLDSLKDLRRSVARFEYEFRAWLTGTNDARQA